MTSQEMKTNTWVPLYTGVLRGLLPPALPGQSGTLSLATLLPAATALVINKKLPPPLISLALDSKFWKETFNFRREAVCPLRRGITSLPWAFVVQSEPTFSLWITYLGACNMLPGTPKQFSKYSSVLFPLPVVSVS